MFKKIFLFLFIGGVLTCCVQKETNKTFVGIGVEFNTHGTPVWIALSENTFKKDNIPISTVFKFRSGLELAAAMGRGEVDIAWICLAPALRMIDEGVPIKIVGKVHDHGYALVVNPEKIKSITDLNDITVYSPGNGTPSYLLLLRIEEKYGVNCKKGFMSSPNILAALQSGQIDAAVIPEHYSTVAEEKGLRILIRSQDLWSGMPGSVIVVKEEILEKSPELVRKIVTITKENVRRVREDPTSVAKIVSKELGVSEDIARKSISKIEWDTQIDFSKVQDYIDFMYGLGLIHKKLNAKEIIEEYD